jgi:hypothetical protein
MSAATSVSYSITVKHAEDEFLVTMTTQDILQRNKQKELSSSRIGKKYQP